MRNLWLPLWVALGSIALFAQNTGSITGTVVLDATKEPMHGVRVTVSPLGRTTDTDDKGRYSFSNLPPGVYDVVALSPGLSDDHQTLTLTGGDAQTADFQLRVAVVRETVTVTSTGREESTLNLIQSVASMDQLQLTQKSAPSLGEVIEGEAGVAKRSSGPGASRPVIRGFDGDRIMVLEDGIGSGSLSYQSGDHGEPIDVSKLERIEVVRGPATLLYGSNAIGGVVNAISRHDTLHQHSHDGVRGFLTGSGGTNNAAGGGSGGFEIGHGDWEFWGSGGGQRTGAYHTELGEVLNSQTRSSQTDAGLGRYGTKNFFSFNYGFTDAKYGIPVDSRSDDPEIADLLMRRHTFRVTVGAKDVGKFSNVLGKVSYTDYNHQELVGGIPATTFFNKQLVYRAVFDQKQKGRLSGSIGFQGMYRDYDTRGEEAIAPPTRQNSLAAFAVENVDFETVHLQFGGRFENNSYDPKGLESRSFNGFSGAVGFSKRLWKDGAFVVNYSHSYRAPSLEELYNNGPHPGNLTFEIGNPNLRSEQNNGLDLSLRHHSSKIRAEGNFFSYHIQRFVYLAPTGNINAGLVEADYFQRDARFQGAEGKLDVALNPNLWLNFSTDLVRANLTESKTPLPRIPPLKGRIGFDAHWNRFSVKPELVLSDAQSRIFPTETRTAGYAVFNCTASYTKASTHDIQILSATLFNAGDTLYRNHLSFIKEFAPEIGRGVKVSYTIQFF